MALGKEEMIKRTLVASFCTRERTADFGMFCIEKLGFDNTLNISNDLGFKEKYLQFAEAGLKTDCEYFIRIDGDHFVYDGIFDLLNVAISENYDWLTGVVYDYVMNNYRGGTPQILSRKVLELLLEDNTLMPDRQKPESEFSINIKSRTKMGDVKIFTALHEYEQLPSKVCNSFLNRLYRNHYPRLYNDDYLRSLPEHYVNALSAAFEFYSGNRSKVSMGFLNFEYLDSEFSPIKQGDFADLYESYKIEYDRIRKQVSIS